MKESTGALIWIFIIIIFVICVGLTIRSIKKGLSEPKAKSAIEEHMEQQQILKQSKQDQKQMMRDMEKAKRDAERQMRDNQRMLRTN